MRKRGDELEKIEVLEELVEIRVLHKIAHLLIDIRGILRLVGNDFLPMSAVITQGDDMLTGRIVGLVPGSSDAFFATPVDKNGNADALPAGSPVPVFSVDDATVGVSQAADGLSVQLTADAGAAVGGSFNLNWSASFTRLDGTPGSISKTVSVPYLAPPALDPVDVVINQGSPA